MLFARIGHGTKKMGIEHDWATRKIWRRPSGQWFFLHWLSAKTQCNTNEVPRHLHRRKHPGSSSVHISIDRSTYLPVYLIQSYLIELNQIESNTILSHPSIHPSILSNLSNLICRSIYLPLSLSIVLCIYLSIHLSIYVSLYPAIRASMYHVSIMCIHSHISIQDYLYMCVCR